MAFRETEEVAAPRIAFSMIRFVRSLAVNKLSSFGRRRLNSE
jgi:hypothetical protein